MFYKIWKIFVGFTDFLQLSYSSLPDVLSANQQPYRCMNLSAFYYGVSDVKPDRSCFEFTWVWQISSLVLFSDRFFSVRIGSERKFCVFKYYLTDFYLLIYDLV